MPWILTLVGLIAPVTTVASWLLHHPIDIVAVPSILWGSILAFVVSLLYMGGSGVLARTGIEDLHPLEEFAHSVALGFTALSLGTLVLLAAGLLDRVPVLLMLGGWTALGTRIPDPRRIPTSWPRATRFERLSAGLGFSLLVLIASQALLPPTAWDELWYHLHLPRRFVGG